MIKAMDDPPKNPVQYKDLRGKTALFLGTAASLGSAVALHFAEWKVRVVQATTPKGKTSPDIVIVDSALFMRELGLDIAALHAACRGVLSKAPAGVGAAVIIAPPELLLSSTDVHTRHAATEAALRSLVGTLRFEYGARGWKVSLLVPGHVRLPGKPVILRSPSRADMVRRWQTAPIHRLIEPEEVARFVAFLASAASSQMHGASVSLAHDA